MQEKLIVAHRGASLLAPENTLAAFQKAIDLGADGVELDVRKTWDGVLVVIHDPIYQDHFIENLSFEELVQLSNNQIPTLKAVLQLCRGKLKLNAELKEGGYEDLVGRVLLENFNADDCVVTSFSAKTLKKFKQLYPQIKVGLIVGTYPDQIFKIIKLIFAKNFRRQFDFLSLNVRYWKCKIYKLFSLKHYNLWAWTADDPVDIDSLLARPEIAGIITNRPDVALELKNKFYEQ